MPAGRPTKYKSEYCQALVDFFGQDPYEEREIEHYGKDGEVKWADIKLMPRKLPSLVDFAKSIKVGISTVYDWINPKHASYQKEFSETFTHKAKKLQKWALIQGGLMGVYNPAFAKFVAVNISDMRDKQESTIKTDPDNPLKWTIEVVEPPRRKQLNESNQ